MPEYKKLGVLEFGRQLIKLDDLHPEYSLLWKAELHRNQLYRWIFAYCLYSHYGVASELCLLKRKQFYKVARLVKPRGKTRRYFRGKWMEQALSQFEQDFPKPEQAVRTLEDYGDFETVQDVVVALMDHWPQFGLWSSFKMADMLERLKIIKLECPVNSKFDMDKKPKEGAAIFALQRKLPDWRAGVITLCRELREYKAPPRFERPIGPLEAETIFCKWMSHRKGRYLPGKEIVETWDELKGWGPIAKDLTQFL